MANRVKILLVEDDVLVAGMMQDRLTDMGYEVVGAMHSGEETLAFVASHPLPERNNHMRLPISSQLFQEKIRIHL